MSVTIKQIAEMAGVSRGTVDRALHGRDGIDPKVKERVLKLCSELNYKPSRAARQMAMQRSNIKFAYIGPYAHEGFWTEVEAEVRAVKEDLSEYNVDVIIRFFTLYLPHEQLKLIDEVVAEGVSGIALVPLNDPLIKNRLQEIREQGIEIALLNSDLDDFEPLFYIANDYRVAGATAAGIANFIMRNTKSYNILILSGSKFMLSHNQRIEGFLSELESLGANYTILETAYITSDRVSAYSISLDLLKKHSNIDMIFTAAGSVLAVCNAVEDAGRKDEIDHIAFDLTEGSRPYILDGSFTALIGQNAKQQGSFPLMTLFDTIVNASPPKVRKMITTNEIFIKQNAM